jgi:hypothetical protein
MAEPMRAEANGTIYLQLGLVVIQVLIALGSFHLNRRYYKGMTERGTEGLATQKSDVRLKVRVENDKLNRRLVDVSATIVSYSVQGTQPGKLKTAKEALATSSKEIDALMFAMKGVDNDTEIIQSLQKINTLVDNYINADNRTNPLQSRVQIAGQLQTAMEEVKSLWEKSALSMIAPLSNEN